MRKMLFCAAAMLWALPAAADVESAVLTARSMPGVVNASADGKGNLWVSVQNRANAQWDAYAVEMCKVVMPHRARIFMVKVIDFTSIRPKTKPQDWRVLGAANCGAVTGE